MMGNITDNYRDYFEILELEPDENITLLDIENAYQKLKALYSSGSIVMDPLDDEMGGDEHAEILGQLEEAYKVLIRYIVDKDRQKMESREQEKQVIIEDTLVEYFPPEEADESAESEESTGAEAEGEPEAVDIPETVVEAEETVVIENDREEELTRLELDVDMEDLARSPQAAYDAMEYTPSEGTVSIELPEDSEVPAPVEPVEVVEDAETDEPVEIVEADGVSEPSVLVEPEESPEPPEPSGAVSTDDSEELEVTIDETALRAESDLEERLDTEKSLVKGRTLRKFREKRGLGIHEVALSTRISYRILVNIEKERFDELPDAGYLRWYVSTYAKALTLDSKKVADEYMKRYRKWERERGKRL